MNSKYVPVSIAPLFLRACCVGLVLWFAAGAPLLRADEYDTLRQKWATLLAGGSELELGNPAVAAAIKTAATVANDYWATMDKSPTRTELWKDAASPSISGHLTKNYSRLRAMALAYVTVGSALHGNATLRTDILGGLDWMYAHRYNETKTIYDNWWDFEIGAPSALEDATILLYPELSATQLANYMNAVEKFVPSASTPAPGGTKWSFTGANRMWKISVVVARGILVKDSAKLAAARDAFSNLFVPVRAGDGFYADGSFIQHEKHPYSGGYGASLIDRMARVLFVLNAPNAENAKGSSWRVVDPNLDNFYRWVFSAYEPLIFRGAMMAMTQGRELSRSYSSEHVTGHRIMDSILLISQFAPPKEAAHMRSMLKYWAIADTSLGFLEGTPLGQMHDAEQLLADPMIKPQDELTGTFIFASMDRVVHRRPGYTLALSMSSNRIYTYESIMGENTRGWHTGDGMLYLYNSDLTQFTDDFWPTVDARRLPGTTIDTEQPRAAASIGNFAPPTTWVGGTTLGDCGIAGMELQGWNSSLAAKKSWFMFDTEVVCLGSDISSRNSRPIETIVENRLLHPDGVNLLTVDGSQKPNTADWSESMAGVSWAHLAGRTSDADIGYYFPQPAKLNGLRETRTGTWRDINASSSTAAPTSRNYLTLWFAHGKNPSHGDYAYVLLPGFTAEQVASYALKPSITILANTIGVQAVRKDSRGLTGANFWADGPSSVGNIAVDHKASVLLRVRANQLAIAVSDPTQMNSGVIAVDVALPALKLIEADAGVSVLQLTPTLRLSVDVKGAAGRTFVAHFQTAGP